MGKRKMAGQGRPNRRRQPQKEHACQTPNNFLRWAGEKRITRIGLSATRPTVTRMALKTGPSKTGTCLPLLVLSCYRECNEGRASASALVIRLPEWKYWSNLKYSAFF